MEPIHSKPLIRLKGPLGIQYLTKAGIKIGKLLVGCLLYTSILIKRAGRHPI